MPNTKFLGSLEAEIFKKQKWPMFCGTPCIEGAVPPMAERVRIKTLVKIYFLEKREDTSATIILQFLLKGKEIPYLKSPLL